MEKLKARLAEIDSDIGLLSDERNRVRKLIAEKSTEFKVGDRVSSGNGKPVFEITEILPGWNGGFKLIGAKIKKDGSLYAIPNELFEWGKEKFTLVPK